MVCGGRPGTRKYNRPVSARRLRILGIGNARSRHLARWAHRLAERGHEVHLATTRTDLWPGELDGIAVHVVQRSDRLMRVPGLRRLRIAHALRGLAEQLAPDVVHSHYVLPYGYWTARAGLQPLVLSPWGSDVLVHARRGGRPERWAREAVSESRLFVVNSKPIADALVELGADPARIRRILWHADIGGFHPAQADRARWRELGWPADAVVVLSLRNFRQDTNLDVVVRAFAKTARAEPRARLLLAARTGPTRAEIEALVAAEKLESLVAVRTIPPEELPGVVASADIAITLARSDSSPASLLESMASGLPLVAGDAPSIDEWVAQGDGAEIVRPHDLDAVSAAVLRLVRDPDLRAAYGSRNVRVVHERFGDPARELEQAYEEALAA
jgi:glycosyltransferase involved in cell wall biosynthesis